MPHVVFDKNIDLEEFSKKFQPVVKKESGIIRLQDVFVNKTKNIALVRSIVIDNLHQEFMMEVDTGNDTTTLRLYPKTDPEKTDGVKSAMGLVALFILYISPNTRIIRTNMEPFIPRRIIDAHNRISI